MSQTIMEIIRAATLGKSLTPNTENYLKQLVALHEENSYSSLSSIQLGEETKQVSISIPEACISPQGYIELVQIADVQFGHKACKYAAFDRFLDWILAVPWRFALLVGDMLDAASAFTPGTPFDNLFNAQAGVYRFSERMARIRHRVLGYVGGNHERRTLAAFGDLGTLLATLMAVPYSSGRQYIDVHFGNHQPFQILMWHGYPRAKTVGALGQIMERFVRIGKAKLYVTAHNHQGLTLPKHREVVRDGKIEAEFYVGMTCTSFLETWATYAEWMGFEAYDVMMPRVRLFPDGEWEAVNPSKNR